MILTLTGASGAGKSTLAKALINLNSRVELSPGCTTRLLRPGETTADVHQLSQQEFSDMKQRGEFLWAVEIHGNWYGTLRRIVSAALSNPDQCLLFVLTPDVLPILKDFASGCGQLEAVRSIYVRSPEPGVLRTRLSARENDSEVIERRLADCLAWDRAAEYSSIYDLQVSGDGDIETNAKNVIDSLSLR